MTKNAISVFVGILLALLAIRLYRRYQLSKAAGVPFDIMNALFGNAPTVTPPKGTYKYDATTGNCYYMPTNGDSPQQVPLKNCYTLSGFASALVSEYTNIQNQLSAIPNPNDPNDADRRAKLAIRAQAIKDILKDMNGCTPNQDIDLTTLTCIQLSR